MPVFLAHYIGTPQISFFAYYNYWGPQLTFFANYMHMGAPQISFFAYYMGVPLDQLLCILFRDPSQISFFAYYMGPISFVLHTTCIWALSNQFLCILYWGPQRSTLSLTIWRPLRSVFFTYYMGPPSG